jgi:glycerophosphoryl diester phosphodiesterase
MRPLHPYLDHHGPIAFAHRGGATAEPENTLRAFADAVDLGYQYIETDVHATSDGVLVAFHDDDLSRTCGVNKKIAESTWDELRDVRVHDTEPIPLLEDILGAWPELKVNIDCKADPALQPLIQTLERTNSFDRVCIGSFSDKRLGQIRAHFGDKLCTSMGPREVAKLVAVGNTRLPVSPSAHAHIAQVPVKQGPLTIVTKTIIDHAHSHGIAVHVWTIDEPAEMNRLLDLGVDGIMTDDTRALRDVFLARGIW